MFGELLNSFQLTSLLARAKSQCPFRGLGFFNNSCFFLVDSMGLPYQSLLKMQILVFWVKLFYNKIMNRWEKMESADDGLTGGLFEDENLAFYPLWLER